MPFFFKQWGGVRKGKTGRQIDGRTYDGLPGRISLPVLDLVERNAAIKEIEARVAATSSP